MNSRKYNRHRLALVGSAALAMGVASASAAEPTTQELLDKISSLQAKVEQLQTRQEAVSEQLGHRTSEQVQADANRHSQSLDVEGFTAGYKSDKGFVLQSGDGRFLLHPWLQFMFRNTTTFRTDSKGGGTEDDLENGFEVRRLKFGFDGNLFSPDLTYYFNWQTDRKTGALALEQAWAKYKIEGTPFAVKGGQFKNPLDHEQLLSTKFLQAADRTITDDIFLNGEGFVQGVSLIYDNGNALRAEGAFTDGSRSLNTNFQDFPTNNADWGIAGRGEFKAFGRWADYDKSLGAYGMKEDLLVVGAGADYTEAGNTNVFTHVLDAQYGSTGGLGLYGAFVGRANQHATLGASALNAQGGTTGTAAGFSTYDYSFRAEASYALDKHWSPFVQYEYLHFDGAGLPTGVKENINAFRIGTNYFLYGYSARFTVDLTYLPNGSLLSDDGAGVLPTGTATKTTGLSTGDNKNEVIVRAQFQLLL